MKKLILFSLISLFSIGIKAQDSGLKGAWTGKLNVFGNELTLVFHFNGEDCTLDSPDQGVKGVPAKLERTVTGIKVAVPSINASYEGVFGRIALPLLQQIFPQKRLTFTAQLLPMPLMPVYLELLCRRPLNITSLHHWPRILLL